MTEWEYLYCKLLLINNVIEGDDGLMLKKQFSSLPAGEVNLSSKEKKEQKNPCCNLYSNREQDRKWLKLFSSDSFEKTVLLFLFIVHVFFFVVVLEGEGVFFS